MGVHEFGLQFGTVGAGQRQHLVGLAHGLVELRAQGQQGLALQRGVGLSQRVAQLRDQRGQRRAQLM